MMSLFVVLRQWWNQWLCAAYYGPDRGSGYQSVKGGGPEGGTTGELNSSL